MYINHYMGAKENLITRNCWVWLNQNGYFAWRNNSVGVWDEKNQCYRKPPPECIAGVSDLCALKNGITYYIEVKDDGGKQNADQILFENQCKIHGVPYFVVRSVEELICKLK